MEEGEELENNGGGLGSIIFIILVIWGINSYYKSPTVPETVPEKAALSDYSSYDTYDTYNSDYEIEREKPDGSYTVEACSQNSGNCYDLDADILDGVVETIYFPNGGHLDLDGAELDEDYNASGESYTNTDGYNGDSWDITCSDCE